MPTPVGSARLPRGRRAAWGGQVAGRVVSEIAVLAGGRLRPETAERLHDLTADGYRLFLAVLDGDEQAGSTASLSGLVGDLFDASDVSLEDAMALHRHLEHVLVQEAQAAAPFAAIEPELLRSVAHRFFNDLAAALTDAYLGSRRADSRDRDGAEEELLGCLLSTPPRIGAARRLARGLELDLDGPWQVAVVSSCEPGGALSDSAIVALRRRLRGAAVLVARADPGAFLALRPSSATTDWGAAAAGLVCGVGDVHADVRGLRESHVEALEAVEVARRQGRSLVHFDDAWFDRFLLGSLSAHELAELVLAPLADLTEHRRAVVLETLEAYLDSGSSLTAVADALHLHRQSVNYRMQNVRRLFGSRLASANGRLALHIAVKATRLPPL